jgi:hypothetical protein
MRRPPSAGLTVNTGFKFPLKPSLKVDDECLAEIAPMALTPFFKRMGKVA